MIVQNMQQLGINYATFCIGGWYFYPEENLAWYLLFSK